ncbi:MAG: DUF58 domain-containing protein [Thiotrichales bacterium]|nr:MAG: DUF58 domain-containing protein [Thiotrichales bacterium]
MNTDSKTDGLTWISQQSLIKLRHDAGKLPLHSSKIHARQGGAYMSSFKGRGMEFDESRLYMPGDDIRNMDWRVTARTGDPHTKVFREERERPVLIWLDLNPSMFFATRGCFKAVAATRAAALLAWSSSAQNDRLGALIFAGDDHIELKPRRGKSAVLDLIGRTCKHPAWQNWKQRQPRNTGRAMSRLRKVTRPGSLLFLISDFRDMDEQAESHLINVARHNDVVLIQVYDPIEAELPPPGSYRVSDGDSELQLNTADKTLRSEYRQRFDQHSAKLAKLCRQHRMYLLPVSTQDDVLTSLQQGLGIPASKHAQFRARS